MKTWNETADVLAAARIELLASQACALVILTHVKGSAFRRPGAKLLVRADGTMTGNVSGGCLENDLRERALSGLASGRQTRVHYTTGSDEDTVWGLGLGCDGELDLLLVPLHGARHLGWIEETLARIKRHHPFALAWSLVEGPAVAPRIADTAGEDFLDQLQPPPDLVVVGAGDDAIPLVDLAARVGFRVTVVDHRSGYLDASRFPSAFEILSLRPDQARGRVPEGRQTLVVIKNHALETDARWAVFYDATPVAYIGILGPQKRNAHIQAEMTAGSRLRVFGPAGLDIGSDGAEQIAVSLVAELLSVWAGRTPTHLRQREGAIHG
jgi:xanthine/CO dehydrogenase XdhC/CoxF family maturation factor